MGACKGCNEIVSSIEIKQGLCLSCQAIGSLDKIQVLQKEKEEELESSKGELIHNFQTENRKGIASLLMAIGLGLFYYYYSNHGN